MSLHPNVLTVMSLFSSLLFFVFLLNGMYIFALISLFASVFDVMDGYIARKTGRASRFGGFLDATIDRISDFFYISAFGFAGLVMWEVVVFAIFTSFLVSYIRACGEAAFLGRARLEKGLFQRFGRLLLIGSSLALFVIFPGFTILRSNVLEGTFVVIIFLNTVTIFQRMTLVWRQERNV